MARIPDDQIERLKNEVSLERLVTGFGIELKRHGGLPCPLPITEARQSGNSQREPQRHELQCGVALPDQLMSWGKIVPASEIAADPGDHAYRLTQQFRWLQFVFFA